jgi:hypothetical protein
MSCSCTILIWHHNQITHFFTCNKSPYLTLLSHPPLLPTCSQQVSRVFVISFDHNQAHTIVGRTPLDEGSARRRDLYLTTQTLYKTNIHASSGIRTHDPTTCSAADLSLRPRGYWDQIALPVTIFIPSRDTSVHTLAGAQLQQSCAVR